MAQQVIVNGKPHPRLYWRGRTIWYRGPDPNGSGTTVRVTTDCKDPIAASLKAADFERSAASPSYRSSRETELGTAIDTWIAKCQADGLATHTIECKKTKLGHFLTLWGEKFPLARIDAAKTTSYWYTRKGHCVDNAGKKPVREITIALELRELRSLLKHHAFIGLYSTPLDQVFSDDFSGETRDCSGRYPRREEVVKLLTELDPHRAAHVAWAIATSSRMRETWRARRSDVVKTESGRLVTIHASKTRHARELATGIPVVEELVGKLLDFALENAPGEDLLFGEWASGQSHDCLKRACRRTGLPPFSWNDFRRAVPNWLLDDGMADEIVLAKLLRHAGLGMIKNYIRRMAANPERVRKLLHVQMGQARAQGLEISRPALPPVSAANSLPEACTGFVPTEPVQGAIQETQETGRVINFPGNPQRDAQNGLNVAVGDRMLQVDAFVVDLTPKTGSWMTVDVPDLYQPTP